MRLSTVILPTDRWAGAAGRWRRAEELGVHAAYTYDHLSWRSFRDRTWFGALPTLAAAAGVTHRLRLGTLVTSPNFRHPVPLAKEVLTLDDLAGGRFTLGIGSGGTGFDATVLGGPAWSPAERSARFAEFVTLLDALLTDGSTTWTGRYYSADGARNLPGCVQRPRVPFAVAATGPRGLDLAARYGAQWVTYGDPAAVEGADAGRLAAAVGRQVEQLEVACAAVGREPTTIGRLLLQGLTAERPLDSVDAFVEWAGRYRDLGIDEVAVHWPVPDSVFDGDQDTFERILTEAPAQLR
jgi:alkanesulfonate monooxygenase SsuD/methylene tetrahydromethanopterin reductase-like flavin-dependent oxidoreductase (luciferase family)